MNPWSFLLDTTLRELPSRLGKGLRRRLGHRPRDPLDSSPGLTLGVPEMCNRVVLLRRMFEIVKKTKPWGPYTIVEIGCFRGDFRDGEGTTYFFAKWLAENGGGTLHTVDLDASSLEQARAALGRYNEYVQYHHEHSEQFLAAFNAPIDLLLLDSIGWHLLPDPPPAMPEFNSQYQHWKDWTLAKDNLRGALGVDDTKGLEAGKGALIAAYLQGVGAAWETVYCVTPDWWPCGIVAAWPPAHPPAAVDGTPEIA